MASPREVRWLTSFMICTDVILNIVIRELLLSNPPWPKGGCTLNYLTNSLALKR